MGEVVISSEEVEVRTESEFERKRKRKEESFGTAEKSKDGVDGSSDGLMRWESLLPRMVLRVLLVEADDSTRQIVAALLRKCSYKVAAVPDGLKAWEILKGSPHNIDLILTEVDLPSISGYALLTLIMEHEICKKIPVIMMSSEDSISTVYKCMLRGAADYLVKPIRRNELRNLWQHVWRRQSSHAGGNGTQDESVGQDKAEATSENNAASNHSIDDMACIRKSKEYIEKGSDAQSSCTKGDMEAESAHKENMEDSSLAMRGKFLLNNMIMQKHTTESNFVKKLLTHGSEAGGAVVAACKDSNALNLDKDVEPESQGRNSNIAVEACDNNDVLVNSSREAIDFMGASATNHNSSNNEESNFDSSPHLDLSLRRSHPVVFDIQVREEKRTLKHSNSSAFTRYTNRPLQSLHSTVESACIPKELGANSDKKLPSDVGGYKNDAPGPPLSAQGSIISLATDQTKESAMATSCPKQRIFPIQIPAEDMRFNNLCTSHGSMFPSMFCKQSVASPIVSPSSATQPEPSNEVDPFHQSHYESNSEQRYDQLGQNANNSTNRIGQRQDHKLDSLVDREHISPVTEQSASSSFCNGAVSHLNSMGYGSTSGSNSNVDQVAIVRTATESNNEEVVFSHNTNSHRSIQREAALTKFRLKRKERCYEKKVRYESRKKLAEQRPRVKGQFVRQAHIDLPPAKS